MGRPLQTGVALKHFRETDLRMTVKQAAELAEVSVRAWQRWEDGSREMPRTVWKLVSSHLDLHIARYDLQMTKSAAEKAFARAAELETQLQAAKAQIQTYTQLQAARDRIQQLESQRTGRPDLT